MVSAFARIQAPFCLFSADSGQKVCFLLVKVEKS